ncbi:HEAT repeat domain-containing protein [Sorangium sp. So ce1000]|uniref:HEAT repeat domain-containing protein n=1 Tax=Sorangium sp. So ce1000 TaxID=3133325 RepID=UPI003F5EACD9
MVDLDETFAAALRRADVRWLAEHLDEARRSEEALRQLVRHEDERVRYLGLARMAQAAPRESSAGRKELAALLPRTLDGTAETALLLAGLYRELWPSLQEHRLPPWREASLPAAARVAWLRTEILTRPQVLRGEPAGELLYQALHALDPAEIPAPEALLPELAARRDPVLAAAALDLTRRCLHAALLAPEQARAALAALLDAPAPAIVAAALRELAEPWAVLAGAPLPGARLEQLLRGAPEVAAAALETAARHGEGGLLRAVVRREDAPPRLRQQALALLGEHATREDVGAILEAAADDPLLLGSSAIACLRAMHRRGHFPAPEHAAALLDLALADRTIAADDVAAIAFTCRRALLEALAGAPAGDASWPRRAEILVAMAQQGAADLPLGDTLAEKLRDAPSPAPLLRALGALRHAAAEDEVLAALPRAPAAALDALAAIGGPRTADALRAALGLAGAGAGAAIAPHLRGERGRAVALLWHLTEDPADRRALVARLNPRDLPAEIAADLGGAEPAELAVLQRAVKRCTPADALKALARAGDAGALPAIADLLLRIAADHAAAWAPGGPPEPPDPDAPDVDRGPARPAEPEIPADVAEAIRGLGRRLHQRRKIRPACLLDAASEGEAGDALLASIALDLLDRPGVSAGERALLVDLLRSARGRLLRSASGQAARSRVPRLLRHRDPRVRKRVIALLAEGGAEALSASLTLLTGAGDVQTARQALRALGGMEARWACPAIAACLDHPNMGIKKTAAEALARAGGPEAVPRLVFWLGRHDNPGLRAAIEAALRAIVGPACEATILAAAGAVEDERARDRLLDALSHKLSTRAIRSGIRQGSTAAARLLERVFAGEIALASGTADELAVELEAHGLPARERGRQGAAPPPLTAEALAADALAAALARDGWDEATARRLLERQAALTQRWLAGLRKLAPEWLRLAAAEPALRDAALRLIVRASTAPWPPAEARLYARQIAVLLDGLAAAAADLRDALLPLIEEAAPELPRAEALGVAARVRGLAPAPGARRSPLEALRRCGAILDRADVDQALAMARVAADPWTAEPAILREAFGATAEAGKAADPEGAAAFRAALRAAALSPEALAALRAAPRGGLGSRAQLAALIEAFPAAAEAARPALLDWMESLQPIGAPPWILAEQAASPSGDARVPRPSDLDQPRSAALRERLLSMLAAPAPALRREAAAALLSWPDADARAAVLRAYLRGDVDGADRLGLSCLSPSLLDLGEDELRGDPADEARRERAARLAALLEPAAAERLFPLLLSWWEAGAPATRAAAAQAIRRVAPDARAERLVDRLRQGAWGCLDLVAGEGLLRTPEIEVVVERLRAEGRADLAERFSLDDGPLLPPGGGRAAEDARALDALRAPPEPRAPAASDRGPARQELVRLARTGDAEQSRRALSALAGAPDAELAALLVELLGDRRPRVRLHAHRLLRDAVDRAAYLRATCALLSDPLPDVVRSAIRILCFAPWPPALPAVVGLLLHPHAAVRRAAAEGLGHVGAPAIPALQDALGRARPDRREVYAEVMRRIEAP